MKLQKIIKNALNMEYNRAILAKKVQFNSLLKTYSQEYPNIPDLNTSKFWDNLNEDYKITKKDNPIAFHRFTIFKKLINTSKKVLNIGVGAGILEEFISKNNALKQNWFGIDIAPNSIKRLRKKYPNATLKIAKIQKIPFKDNFFYYVIASEILEHIVPSEIFQALSEVNRVLEKGGIFIVSVPLNEGLENMVKKGENPNAHVRVYTPELIEAELQLAGFKVKRHILIYAFPNYYWIKSFIVKYILSGNRKPNNMIVLAVKL